MEYEEIKKEMLILRINVKRNSIENLKMILNSYKIIMNRLLVKKENILPGNFPEIDLKLFNIFKQINLITETLLTLESELFILEEIGVI